MLELNDMALEMVAGGWHGAAATAGIKITNTNNSTVELKDFSVKGSGGLLIAVTQSIG